MGSQIHNTSTLQTDGRGDGQAEDLPWLRNDFCSSTVTSSESTSLLLIYTQLNILKNLAIIYSFLHSFCLIVRETFADFYSRQFAMSAPADAPIKRLARKDGNN